LGVSAGDAGQADADMGPRADAPRGGALGAGALVPVHGARPDQAGAPAGLLDGRVPISTAPQPTAALAAPTALMLQVAAGQVGQAATAGVIAAAPARGGASGGENATAAPGEAATVSQAYRRRGGWPPLQPEPGRIFRASI
jgi:hypothetical protein